MLQRVLYAQEHIVKNEDGSYGDFYSDGFDEIHLDEKWFYITQISCKFYLSPYEDAPTRKCTNKSHLIKVMFLCAVARPIIENNVVVFDGKIGCWPIIERRPAERRSVNRPRGTIVSYPVNVTQDIYKNLMINRLLPAIRLKWPRGNIMEATPIRLQHDNATSHRFREDDPAWVAAKTQYGNFFTVSMKGQPPNSPDTNVLDLGFFNSLQSLQQKQEPANTIDELIGTVLLAWDQYDCRILNRTFITHRTILNEIIECNGDNDYTIPHMGKQALERQQLLPRSIRVSDAAKALLGIG